MNIGENIKRIRKQKGLSQEELAKKVLDANGKPLSRVSITRYENGRDPNAVVLDKIARALEVSVEELIEADSITSKEKAMIGLLTENTKEKKMKWYPYELLTTNEAYKMYLNLVDNAIQKSSYNKNNVSLTNVYYCNYNEADYILIQLSPNEKWVLLVDPHMDNIVFEFHKSLKVELEKLATEILANLPSKYDSKLNEFLDSMLK